MNVCRPLLAALLVAQPGCTAIGAWVYDDPSFTLHAVTIRADSVDLVYMGCNRNDYDLLGEDFSARLAVAGNTVAEGGRDQPVFLATRDSSEFTVTVPLRGDQLAHPGKGQAYALETRGVLRTPAGTKHITALLHGKVSERGEALNWLSSGRPCRPGLSALPGVFDRRVPLDHPANEPRPADRGPGMQSGSGTGPAGRP